MNETELRQLIQADESESLEFKQALVSRKEIGEYAVGIGNQGGGWMIMGVTDTKPRRIAGLPEFSAAELRRIRDSVLDATGIRVEPWPVATSEGRVLAIEIPARPRGHIFSTRTGSTLPGPVRGCGG